MHVFDHYYVYVSFIYDGPRIWLLYNTIHDQTIHWRGQQF